MLLTSLLHGQPLASYGGAWAPDDDRWYGRTPGAASLAGVAISEDTARAISTVYRCVAILGGLVGYLPLMVYRWRPDDGKDRAANHPLWDLLHDAPNGWQTSFEWRELGMNHLLMRGNFYNEIIPGPRGFVDQLKPLHPDTVAVKQLDSGRLTYAVRRRSGQTDVLVQDQVFHVRGPSKDGITGLDVITLMRESLGLAGAAESFGARTFRDRPMMSGILKHPGKLDDEASKRMAESFRVATSGANAHAPAVLEDGVDWVSVGITPEQAQYLELRHFQIADIARWFGVPLQLLGETEKSTSWGSGIESLMIGFVIHTLAPWLKRWEQAIARDLILASDVYFAEFTVEALLRGDTKSLYEAFAIATGGRGWMAPNEVRGRLNLNPIPGYDEIAREAQGAASSGQSVSAPPPRQNAVARAIVHATAERLVRKEIAAVTKAAERRASAPEAWHEAVIDFYVRHVDDLGRDLKLSEADAVAYTGAHRDALLAAGLGVIDDWTNNAARALAALAMGEEIA